MIDGDTITDWLTGVTYRPGWAIAYGGTVNGNSYVIVWASGPDVCDPGKEFKTGPLFKVPDVVTREAFYDWLIDECIPGVEQHERYEWFRVKGKHHRDPHSHGMPAFATEFEK